MVYVVHTQMMLFSITFQWGFSLVISYMRKRDGTDDRVHNKIVPKSTLICLNDIFFFDETYRRIYSSLVCMSALKYWMDVLHGLNFYEFRN